MVITMSAISSETMFPAYVLGYEDLIDESPIDQADYLIDAIAVIGEVNGQNIMVAFPAKNIVFQVTTRLCQFTPFFMTHEGPFDMTERGMAYIRSGIVKDIHEFKTSADVRIWIPARMNTQRAPVRFLGMRCAT